MECQKILLSIHPEYVKKIISGEKKWEFRKVLPKGRFDTIVIYSTYPVRKIIGEVECTGIFMGTPKKVWEETKCDRGIEKDKYLSYYRDIREAVAFRLGKVTVYETPKTLEELGLSNAPQSFVYLK